MACSDNRDEESSIHGKRFFTHDCFLDHLGVLGKQDYSFSEMISTTADVSQSENYGDSHTQSNPPSLSSPSSHSPATKSVLQTILTDKRILTLGLASCFFEGSMYLFVFFWTPALKAAHSQALPSANHS